MAHHFNNLTSLQWKARARMTLILNMAIHGRSEEECLEITVNEHGQPIGPDDATCNEFISFLGTIARKAHIVPLTSELQELDSEKDVDTVILNIIGSDNKKKCRLNLHGRGKVEEKQAKEVEAIQKDYEDKRQQDRSMFGSLLLDGQPEKDTNPVGLLQLHSSSSTSKEMNNNVEGEEEEEEDDDNN
ncbi:Succinate--CoA ligase [ADP-forming] subunit beta [Bienertia sinuspersici]